MRADKQSHIFVQRDQPPHSSLGMMTPTAIEENVETIDDDLRPEMKIYQWNHHLSTKSEVFNKEKSSKKEKVNIIN
jgi:RecA-family ATPase